MRLTTLNTYMYVYKSVSEPEFKQGSQTIVAYSTRTLIYVIIIFPGRFLMGSCQGAVTVILRTYIGETSSTIIASLPPEQREKSTLKYTAFFVTFTVCTLSVLAGPGKLSLSLHIWQKDLSHLLMCMFLVSYV